MDYAFSETTELGRGGMAVVYKAFHTSTSQSVALKLPLPWPDARDRLRREIEVLSTVSHPNVMTLVDHGQQIDGEPWYAMPLAIGSLRELWGAGKLGHDHEMLAKIILTDVAAGLNAIHEAGYLHRDVTPSNILAMSPSGNLDDIRWVIADCGLARRPLGQTTQNLTGTSSRLGTDGYMAPESSQDPHHVTMAADIYGLGRILAWILTGQRPTSVLPLLPTGTPWRSVIRSFTKLEATERPQTITEALQVATELLAEMPISDSGYFRATISKNSGVLDPSSALWDLVSENLNDFEFMIDILPLISLDSASALARIRPDLAASIAERLAYHMHATAPGAWNRREYNFANKHLDWILAVLSALEKKGHIDNIGDIAPDYCRAVTAWTRFAYNARLKTWLVDLGSPAAGSMARAIRDSNSIEYFRGIVSGWRVQDDALATLLSNY